MCPKCCMRESKHPALCLIRKYLLLDFAIALSFSVLNIAGENKHPAFFLVCHMLNSFILMCTKFMCPK
jgi:hypothetical protein